MTKETIAAARRDMDVARRQHQFKQQSAARRELRPGRDLDPLGAPKETNV